MSRLEFADIELGGLIERGESRRSSRTDSIPESVDVSIKSSRSRQSRSILPESSTRSTKSHRNKSSSKSGERQDSATPKAPRRRSIWDSTQDFPQPLIDSSSTPESPRKLLASARDLVRIAKAKSKRAILIGVNSSERKNRWEKQVEAGEEPLDFPSEVTTTTSRSRSPRPSKVKSRTVSPRRLQSEICLSLETNDSLSKSRSRNVSPRKLQSERRLYSETNEATSKSMSRNASPRRMQSEKRISPDAGEVRSKFVSRMDSPKKLQPERNLSTDGETKYKLSATAVSKVDSPRKLKSERHLSVGEKYRSANNNDSPRKQKSERYLSGSEKHRSLNVSSKLSRPPLLDTIQDSPVRERRKSTNESVKTRDKGPKLSGDNTLDAFLKLQRLPVLVFAPEERSHGAFTTVTRLLKAKRKRNIKHAWSKKRLPPSPMMDQEEDFLSRSICTSAPSQWEVADMALTKNKVHIVWKKEIAVSNLASRRTSSSRDKGSRKKTQSGVEELLLSPKSHRSSSSRRIKNSPSETTDEGETRKKSRKTGSEEKVQSRKCRSSRETNQVEQHLEDSTMNSSRLARDAAKGAPGTPRKSRPGVERTSSWIPPTTRQTKSASLARRSSRSKKDTLEEAVIPQKEKKSALGGDGAKEQPSSRRRSSRDDDRVEKGREGTKTSRGDEIDLSCSRRRGFERTSSWKPPAARQESKTSSLLDSTFKNESVTPQGTPRRASKGEIRDRKRSSVKIAEHSATSVYMEEDIFSYYAWSLSSQTFYTTQRERQLLKNSIRTTPLFRAYRKIEMMV
jgi:hypothetical protein